MRKVAITGNIASGKSCVEKYIKEAGYPVIDCDKVNAEILASDTNTINEIKDCFNDVDILDENHNISKEKLGKIVFRNLKKKSELEKILHKRIKEKLEIIFNENKNEEIIFVSVPLLFESGFYKDFDKIIFVYAPDEIRLERLIKRNGYDLNYAKQRLNAQNSQEEKIKKSDFVIYNESDFNNLKNQTETVLKQISNLN